MFLEFYFIYFLLNISKRSFNFFISFLKNRTIGKKGFESNVIKKNSFLQVALNKKRMCMQKIEKQVRRILRPWQIISTLHYWFIERREIVKHKESGRCKHFFRQIKFNKLINKKKKQKIKCKLTLIKFIYANA